MKNFFEKKGKLSIIMGKGQLSSYEVNNLKIGDVIKINRTAGEPYYMYFNSRFLCHCYLPIINDYLFALPKFISDAQPQINSMDTIDNVIEILETEVKLAEIDISLKELSDTNENSFIFLEKKYTENGLAELLVEGVPLAKGDVVVLEETFGIKLTEVYYEKSENIEIRTSEYIFDPNTSYSSVKIYDFKKPDMFTKNHLISMFKLHELYLRNLKLMMPELKNLKVRLIDQLAYYELLNELNNSFSVILAGNSSVYKFSTQNETNIQKKTIIKGKSFEGTIDNELINKIESINLQPKKPIPFGSILIYYNKNSYFSKLTKNDNSINEFIISPLRSSWKNVINTNLKFIEHSNDFDKIQPIFSTEMILLIEIGDENKPDEKLLLVYPASSISPILNLLYLI